MFIDDSKQEAVDLFIKNAHVSPISISSTSLVQFPFPSFSEILCILKVQVLDFERWLNSGN